MRFKLFILLVIVAVSTLWLLRAENDAADSSSVAQSSAQATAARADDKLRAVPPQPQASLAHPYATDPRHHVEPRAREHPVVKAVARKGKANALAAAPASVASSGTGVASVPADPPSAGVGDDGGADPCSPNPCKNGAACASTGAHAGLFDCVCAFGFTGALCATAAEQLLGTGPMLPEYHAAAAAAAADAAPESERVLQQLVARLLSGDESCEARTPDIVVYNRVPKCGSASLLLSGINAGVSADDHHGQRRYHDVVLRDFPDLHFKAPYPRFFHSHQLFYDFASISGRKLETINQVRHPVDRCVSEFYWAKRRMFHGRSADAFRGVNVSACARRGCFDIPPGTVVATTYDDFAMINQARNIEPFMKETCNNYLTRWFCGMADACMDPLTTKAFETALTNIRDKHIVVSVLEDFALGLEVLRTRLPKIFRTSDGTVANPPDVHAQEPYEGPDAAALASLHQKNRRDVVLFDALRARLRRQHEQCR